jgi:hypothetical protein
MPADHHLTAREAITAEDIIGEQLSVFLTTSRPPLDR